MRIVRRFTAGEDEVIVAMRVAGQSLGAIAKHVGRRKSAVQIRLDTLARQQADRDEPFPI